MRAGGGCRQDFCLCEHSGHSRMEHDLTEDPQMGRSRYSGVSRVNSERSEEFGRVLLQRMGLLLVKSIRA